MTERTVGEHLAVLDIAMSSLDRAIDTYRTNPREHEQLAHVAAGAQRIMSGLWDSMTGLHQLLGELVDLRENGRVDNKA